MITDYSSVVQIKKLRAEIDTQTNKGIIDRVFLCHGIGKDSLIDLHGLVPYWLPHDWRVA